MGLVAKRYAKALFELGSRDLAKAKKERDSLLVLKELFAVPDAARVLRNPVMPVTLKKRLLDYGLDGGGASADVRHFVEAVLGAGRVAFLPQIADAYSELIAAAEGRVSAEVVSSVPLSPEDSQAIAQALGQLLKKTVEIKPHIDPAVLGGFIARVGNYRVDLSLKTRLDGLASAAVQTSLS